MTVQPEPTVTITYEAKSVALVIAQGATFPFGFTWRMDDPENPGTPGDPIDLTGCTAIMQIRKKQGATVLVESSSVEDAPGLTTPGITLGDASGHVAIKLSDEQTDQISVKAALYDLEILFPNGDRYRVLEGPVTTKPNITQVGDEPVLTA